MLFIEGNIKNLKLTYDVYSGQLEPYEKCRRNFKDVNILEVKCSYCSGWYIPTRLEVRHRISGINRAILPYSPHISQICSLLFCCITNDNGIIVCKDCHNRIHKLPGCTLSELKTRSIVMSKKKNGNGKSYKKFYEEGRLSHMKGLLMEENPYDEGLEADAWDMGWLSIEIEGEK
jgi:hypothetical protein